MKPRALIGVLAPLLVAATMTASLADVPPEGGPPTISVSATGSVDFVPDIARLTLGIRIESPTAQAATNGVNQHAAQVIAALRASGVSDRNIKTSSYNLIFREAPPPPPAASLRVPESNAPVSPSEAVAARLALPGNYVATETLEVTLPVNSAGKALDAAIAAGANESFGLNYQTSNAQALYRAALAKAVASARDSAKAIADAAHLAIIAIQSISTNAPAAGPFAAEPMMARSLGAQVLPGTEAISATVFVVYRVR
jgi:uncharacterized protein YggE